MSLRMETRISELIFLQDSPHKLIIQLGESANAKDLFFVCFNLFCKGIAMLYGHENVVRVHKLSREQVADVVQRLRKVNIRVVILEFDVKFADNVPKSFEDSVQAVKRAPANLSLEEYNFGVVVNNTLHQIHFEIMI